jgi:hypothetical protein
MICCHCNSVCYCSPASFSMLICDRLWWQLCPCWWHFSPHSLFLLSLYLSVRLSVSLCVCLSLYLMVVFSTAAVINRAIHTSSIGLDVSPLIDGSCSLTTGSSACAKEQLARSRNRQSKDFTKTSSFCCCSVLRAWPRARSFVVAYVRGKTQGNPNSTDLPTFHHVFLPPCCDAPLQMDT